VRRVRQHLEANFRSFGFGVVVLVLVLVLVLVTEPARHTANTALY
jgi:hypothetical protein